MGLHAAELCSTICISLSYHLEIIQHNIVQTILNSTQAKKNGYNLKEQQILYKY